MLGGLKCCLATSVISRVQAEENAPSATRPTSGTPGSAAHFPTESHNPKAKSQAARDRGNRWGKLRKKAAVWFCARLPFSRVTFRQAAPEAANDCSTSTIFLTVIRPIEDREEIYDWRNVRLITARTGNGTIAPPSKPERTKELQFETRNAPNGPAKR